jgi:hypothetical protein
MFVRVAIKIFFGIVPRYTLGFVGLSVFVY